MQNTAQDLSPYFKSLKKKVHIKNFYQFLIFTVMIQGSLYLVYQIFVKPMFDGNVPLMQTQGICITWGMSIFACLFFWVSLTIQPDVRLLKNKDTVNLYNALEYLYRNNKKKMNATEFTEFIDTLYEKERLQEIISNISTDKELYAKDTEKINTIYSKKEKFVSTESILKREFKGI